jgi:hypothetical protein
MANSLRSVLPKAVPCCALFLCVDKRIFIKKCFLFILGDVYSVKWFQLGGKYFANDEKFETEVRKWLKQQSKDLYAAGFDALVKRRDK